MSQCDAKPFYGAQCPTYPDCKGGCGLGCTHEIEQARVQAATTQEQPAFSAAMDDMRDPEVARAMRLEEYQSQPVAAATSNRDLAEELREYTAMKYAGDCKCGKCQLVPRALVERIYHTLNSTRHDAQPSRWPKEIRSFVNEVAGIWDAFEHGIRQEISNTNYACVKEKLTAVESLLASQISSTQSDPGK